MGTPSPLILKAETPDYGRVVIDASDGNRYHSNLTALSRVYCFPKTREDWDRVAPDGHGLALVWTTRFEVHVDQIIGLADRVEPVQRSA
jgi:hypothetical protein